MSARTALEFLKNLSHFSDENARFQREYGLLRVCLSSNA
jgi:hypothetical protein